jgi:ATP-dependent DNA ligase
MGRDGDRAATVPSCRSHTGTHKRASFCYMVAMTKSARTNPTDTLSTRRRVKPASPPAWIKPQLAALVNKAPDGSDWLHEIKFDGYRMHARLVSGRAQILTRRGNDWTDKYPAIAKSQLFVMGGN